MPEGTVEWAGGETNFDDGPFSMVVKSVEITNYNPACSYVYSDRSGSDDSIDVITSGDSCVSGEVANPKPSSAKPSASTASQPAASSAASSAVSSAVSTASKTATVAPTLSQTVANIVPTAYINTTALASTTLGTSTTAAPSAGLNSTTTGSMTTPSSADYTGNAALNSVANAMSFLAVAAGLWVM